MVATYYVPVHVRRSNQAGFTLVEILLVMAISSILAGFAVVSLIRPQLTASISATTETLISDLKTQQQKSMAGEDNQPHGLKIEPSRYILFRGASYDAANEQNFVVEYGQGVIAETTLPSSEIIFRSGDGALASYSPGNSTITLTHPQAEESHTLELNPYGVVTVAR